MARKDSDNQKKSMSVLFRGKAIFKPLNTGRIDERVACVREWVANIFFYTKNGQTVMIDAGYNYARLKEKMSWLDIDPASIRHIFITHQDTDHVGALERDSELLFKDATVYIGEIENRYLTGEARRRVIYGLYKLPMVKTDNERVLLKDGQTVQIGDIKVECMLVPGHTWGHMVYLVDDEYLFTGDTIWFGADGGYSFLSTLAEDNDLAVQSLEKLEANLRARNRKIKIITGHTGWTDDMDFAFLHRTELCEPFAKKYSDPSAPYDGYVEDDDTEESARNVPLAKVGPGVTRAKPDYKNWVPKGMIKGFAAGSVCCLGLAAVCRGIQNKKLKTVLGGGLLLGGISLGGATIWLQKMHNAFSYDGERQMSKIIIDGIAEYVDLPNGGKGLDVGCGSGALAIACAKRNPNASFVGIDRWGKEYASYNKPLCESNAKAEGASNVSFRQGNAESLDFPDESFDAVTSNYVYHNIPGDRQDLLLETLRVLKKGGTFAIHDIFSKRRYGDMQAFIEKLKSMGYEDARLIDTTDGMFMTKGEALWMDLSGSALLVGRK
jgi:glyoxylase-like metal-dependent hydrolase (beta-lactamase superfamily II)/ubiquinone/menaquinone biosynthesis C-methylase UbiE